MRSWIGPPRPECIEMSTALDGWMCLGAVRYRLKSAPMFVHCCHCLDCQRQTGSAFVLNALSETDRIGCSPASPRPSRCPPTAAGRIGSFVVRAARWPSGANMGAVRRCALCAWARSIPPGTGPDVHIYVRSKQPWLQLPADVPAFQEYYDTKRLWPAVSLERRRALFG